MCRPSRNPVCPTTSTIRGSAILAPAGTPKPILDKVSADIAKVLKLPDVSEKLLNQGSIPTPSTPAELDAINKSDTERYGKILKDAGIKPQ